MHDKEMQFIISEMVRLKVMFTVPSFVVTDSGISTRRDKWTNNEAKELYRKHEELYEFYQKSNR